MLIFELEEFGLESPKIHKTISYMDWLRMFAGVGVLHLPRVASDHAPVLINTDLCMFDGPKPFRFELFGLQILQVFDIVKDAWNQHVNGSPSLVLEISRTK